MQAEIARLNDICDRRNTELAERKRAERAEKEAQEERTELDKTDQLTDAVNRLGSETQRAKWEAGLMNDQR